MMYKTSFPSTIPTDSSKTFEGALDLLAFFLFVISYKITDPILNAIYPLTPFAWLANWRLKKEQAEAEIKLHQVKHEERTRINVVILAMFPTWSSIVYCVETSHGIVMPKGDKSFQFRDKIFCASLHDLFSVNHSEDKHCIQMVNPYFKSALRILEHIASSPIEFREHKEKAHEMFRKLYSEIQPLRTYKNYEETLKTISELSPTLLERAQK